MTMRKIILTVLTASSVLLFCGAVSAQMHRARGGQGGGMQMSECFRGLELTPEQESKIIDQKFAHQQEILPIKRDLMKKRLEMKAELDKENPNQAVLDRISDEMNALEGKMKKSKLHFLLSIRTILTKEQWQEAKQDLMERREGRPGMHRPPMAMEPGRGPCKAPGKPGAAPAPPYPPEDEDL
ncbi:MAG TPA: periplasmic heavy metal sensor [Acidobacteriota bacterium]|jgi:Spy/CpxP family protein refolding chaperone|nr:periplasmic heavy metal sensor [Acidobacteriota bacterium]HNT17017.1 periplasmic heavy metal sensor [Acidobacteriota bacterium]HPA26411.1 periplasmic heavy metal sensor [Acidobacteriota bacterium]HQO19317.1 periplasmic heavy metal sensor [Acidobacteriota bacterium]HQQ46502.1 periplasmic heavy metal sensor [Acidobacteriota bacterium]